MYFVPCNHNITIILLQQFANIYIYYLIIFSLSLSLLSGSYDGCLYVLHSLTGSIHWCFTTKGSISEEPIKSSPIAHPVTGYIWFGSHDHHLYTVDIYVSTCR